MKARKQKLALLTLALLALSGATLLVLNAFQSNIVFFFSPSEISQGKAPANTTFRVGGLVEQDSVKRSSDGLNILTSHKACRSVTPGSCRTCFARVRAWLLRACSSTATSRPSKYWPSMMKTTCRPKPQRPWNRLPGP
jgi:hypothetical protein